MTSSAKKKRERKKDFQKPKLKVGKGKPKAANSTDTSFRAKAIVLNQQLAVDAPSASSQFNHHVSLLSSKSDSQRRDALAFLATYLESAKTTRSLPITISGLLDKISSLILDGSNPVRSQLLKLFQVFPPTDVRDHVPKLLPHVRAGMTHLSRDIRLSSIETLSWLIGIAGEEIVSCAGGWYQTLECFTTILGWRSADLGKWTSSKPSLGDSKSTAKVMIVLAELLEVGLFAMGTDENVNVIGENFPMWQLQFHQIPAKSNAYGYLNLFGTPLNETNQILEDHDDRVRVFEDTFADPINAGIESSRKGGGELGRAGGVLMKVLERLVEADSPA